MPLVKGVGHDLMVIATGRLRLDPQSEQNLWPLDLPSLQSLPEYDYLSQDRLRCRDLIKN